MDYVNILRRLSDRQQYEELRDSGERYWSESGDVQVLPLLALAHAHLAERKPVEEYLARIEEVKDDLDLDGRVDLAAVYILIMRVEEAIRLLDEALQEEEDHSLALARRGWCYMYEGDMEKARSYYERSVELAPDRIQVYTNLLHLFIEMDDYNSAQETLDRAIDQLSEIYSELPDMVVAHHTVQLRELQLATWVASEEFSRADGWLDEKRGILEEEEWAGLVIHYASLLSSTDRHDQAGEALRDGLKHYPDNISLYIQMSELSQVQGQFRQALRLLEKVIRLAGKEDKPLAGFWAKLSTVCLHRYDQKARKAAEKAVELAEAMEADDEHPPRMVHMIRCQAKSALAQVESHEQNYDRSEELFRELLADNPYYLPALQGFGHQQMQRGNIDEAVELFERIKQINPAKGYSSLIGARKFPEDEEALHLIEKAARQPSMEGGVRAGLMNQLASAWEKRKEYDKAFGLVAEANEQTKRFLKYDPKAHRNRCARIRAAFCKELYDHRKDCGVDSTLPVYVLGMPRSGTTLVEQILASHSEIFGAGELGVIPQVVQGLERWERRTGSGRHYPECVDDLNPYVTEGIANNTLKELQEYDPEAKHVIDKLPHNFEHVGMIKFLFPNAKIISVRRDPRDIAISNYFTDYQAKHGGMGFAYDLTNIGEQLADHNMMMHHWNEVFPGEILEVNYEDVIEDTEKAAREMLEYIGVDWEEQVLGFNELDRPVKTASVWQVRQPIYKTSKAKWMRYKDHLAPLIKGTNAKIEFDPITDMNRLPEPGLLVDGVALYNEDKLDEAEHNFKKLLHHVPEHGAANFMVGLIYVRKGHLEDGIELMEKGLEKCPWNKNWRKDLIQAYTMAGREDKAEALKKRPKRRGAGAGPAAMEALDEMGGEGELDAEELDTEDLVLEEDGGMDRDEEPSKEEMDQVEA